MSSHRTRLAYLFLCCVLAGGADARAPAAAKRAALEHYLNAEFPGAKPVGGVLQAAGLVELPAVRRGGMLCRATRLELEDSDGWRVAASYDVAWLNPAGCGARGGKVRLGVGVQDAGAATLLAKYGQLLARARLLVAGDSRCAQERSSRFFLVAIDQEDGMARLAFTSDRPVRLSVYVKPSGTDYDVWKIDCRR